MVSTLSDSLLVVFLRSYISDLDVPLAMTLGPETISGLGFSEDSTCSNISFKCWALLIGVKQID